MKKPSNFWGKLLIASLCVPGFQYIEVFDSGLTNCRKSLIWNRDSCLPTKPWYFLHYFARFSLFLFSSQVAKLRRWSKVGWSASDPTKQNPSFVSDQPWNRGYLGAHNPWPVGPSTSLVTELIYSPLFVYNLSRRPDTQPPDDPLSAGHWIKVLKRNQLCLSTRLWQLTSRLLHYQNSLSIVLFWSQVDTKAQRWILSG